MSLSRNSQKPKPDDDVDRGGAALRVAASGASSLATRRGEIVRQAHDRRLCRSCSRSRLAGTVISSSTSPGMGERRQPSRPMHARRSPATRCARSGRSPKTVAKKASTTPIGVDRGSWMSCASRLPVAAASCACLLHAPVGIRALDLGRTREVPRRRRRGDRPFERAAVPRIAGPVARAVAVADADVRAAATGAARCRPAMTSAPAIATSISGCQPVSVVVLHAPRRAHQAEHIERHEGEVEADQPAPERAPCPSRSSSVKPNALGNQ